MVGLLLLDLEWSGVKLVENEVWAQTRLVVLLTSAQLHHRPVGCSCAWCSCATSSCPPPTTKPKTLLSTPNMQ